ncbi:hypothetical protein CKO28_00190 [Rhodovibrio sodomensis]|uniref:Uncharacterized protein n=1 Tax=Rhodovibrio sodomensis TaxID=1088 RepID=A0ABS1D9P1_9PROT|nr:hypothetical protein [Rhodovibrio sodomensis]MBK1666458.1 hypothetical protein [Rhodovibrio sodomensis]
MERPRTPRRGNRLPMEIFPDEDDFDDRTYAKALRWDAVSAIALVIGVPALLGWLSGGGFSALLS